jgi:flagellar basal body-associated protein FliL
MLSLNCEFYPPVIIIIIIIIIILLFIHCLFVSTNESLKEQAEKEDTLVPIRLELENDGYRLRDTFTWNLNGKQRTKQVMEMDNNNHFFNRVFGYT